MAYYQYGNYSIPMDLMREYLCDKYSFESVKQIFNISCDSTNNTLYNDTTDKISIGDFTTNSNGLSSSYGSCVLALCIVVFVLGIAFNVGLLTLLSTQKRFFKPSWYYVYSLVVADVLVLCNMVAFVIAMLLPSYPLQGRFKIFLFSSLDMFLSSASMLSVAAIALDRVLTVCTFERLSAWYRKRKVAISKVAVPCMWLYCIAIFTAAILSLIHI